MKMRAYAKAATEGEVTLDELAEHAAGLVALTGGADGPLTARLPLEARRGVDGRAVSSIASCRSTGAGACSWSCSAT